MWQTLLLLLAFALFGKMMYDLGKRSIEADIDEERLDNIRNADFIIDEYGKLFDELFDEDNKK